MRLSQFTPAATALLSLSQLASASLDCSNVIVKGQKYDLTPLKGDHYVSRQREESNGNTLNSTFGVSICNKLSFDGASKKRKCQGGTWVCGIEEDIDQDEDTHSFHEPINIAGSYTFSNARPLDPSWSRISDSQSHEDRKRKGLRLELNGGKHPWNAKKSERRNQKAIIEFECDLSRDGLEDEDSDNPTHWPRLARREDDDDENDDGASGCDDNANNRSLSICSYGPEDSHDVLRLRWKTKWACENMSGGARQDSGSHWGFFTWLIVIIFLGVAGYLIFGSWLNYSRYGARGWDLIPHGETIRDIPYIVKDFGRNISNAVSSGGSRGGYSAV